MNELVSKLTTGRHPIEAVVRPDKTLEGFRAALERGYVHVKFTDTLGGTELGIRLDPSRTNLSGADFDAGCGELTVSGSLTLDYVPVTCVALIRLPQLTGEGWLEPAASASSPS